MSVVKKEEEKKEDEKTKDFVKRTCDPCRFEEKDSKAQGYCKICREFLCSNCEKFHKKFQTTRSHKIVHGVLMPKPVQKAMLQCEHHPNNQVEWFCKDHTDVICTDCKEKRHGICDHVLTLEIFAGRETDVTEVNDVVSDLKATQEEFKNGARLRQKDITALREQKTKCKESIQTIRADFNIILDRLETMLNNELENIYTSEINTLTDQIKVCERAVSSLKDTISATENAKKTEHNLASFCTLTKGKKQLRGHAKALQEIKQGAYTVNLEVVPRPEIAEVMNELVSFGEIKIDVIPTTFHNTLRNLRKENMRVVESKVHSVKMESDDQEHDCEITGSTFLEDGSLILCDKKNHKVKLLDPAFNIQKEHKLSGSPWDVEVVKDKWVIVTVPFLQCLQFVQVDLQEGLRSGRSIKLDQMCWGVVAAGEEIIVSCHDNPGNGKIYILDKRGHKKKVLGVEAEGSRYDFDLPLYLAMNPTGTKLFVADGDIKRTITCIDKGTGQIVYDYSANSFGYSKLSVSNVQQNPWSFKILVDDEDYVFAYVGDKEMVQIVTDKGEKYQVLMVNREELIGPHTMAYRESDSTLVLGLWDQIQTFRFKEIEIKT